jgi:ABC-2 type transport system ATP-binding protein
LGLARVLLHDPQVLLLDEPASGLDPRARIEIRGLLKELRNMGKTIMVSSHILPELADICNKIGIIERGELIVNADVEDVMKQVRQQTVLKVDVSNDREAAGKLLETSPIVEQVEVDKTGLRVTLISGDHDFSQLARLLLDNGHALTKLTEEEINLETAFMTLTKGITS